MLLLVYSRIDGKLCDDGLKLRRVIGCGGVCVEAFEIGLGLGLRLNMLPMSVEKKLLSIILVADVIDGIFIRMFLLKRRVS